VSTRPVMSPIRTKPSAKLMIPLMAQLPNYIRNLHASPSTEVNGSMIFRAPKLLLL
jgi:hypothetical protein